MGQGQAENLKRDLWLFLAGGAFAGGKHSREEVLGTFNLDDAPPDVLKLLTGLVEQKKGPVNEWLSERGATLGDGRSVFQAIGEAVTDQANRKLLRRVKDEISGLAIEQSPEQYAKQVKDKLEQLGRICANGSD